MQKKWIRVYFYWNNEPKKSNNIMSSIYKHLSMDLTDFNNNYWNNLPEKVIKEQKSGFLLGDFKISFPSAFIPEDKFMELRKYLFVPPEEVHWIIMFTIQSMNFWILLHQTLFYHTLCSQLELLATQKQQSTIYLQM